MLDHIFIDRKTGTNQNGAYDFQSVAIDIPRFIEELRQVETDGKGIARFNIFARLKEPDKFNFVVNDWKPTAVVNNGVNSARTASKQPVSGGFVSTGASDTLPF